MLAGYAVRGEQSRGRRHAEPEHPYRDPFQRDRDRVIHTRAFRRLENKTQVFTRRYSDHFRNRLTHTIEVAQISRTVAAQLGLNTDLAEALALAHDLGHPPFGHAGEKALDAVMRRHGGGFDHNLHALRTVEEIEHRYLEFHGLNLTFEVREGIVKHSGAYTEAEHPELAEYRLDLQAPLEAQLIDFTDEIAYSTADLDDGYESQILGIEEICGGVAAFRRFYEEVDSQYPQAAEKLKFNQALRRMLDRFVTDLIGSTAARLRAGGVKTVDDVRGHSRLAGFSAAVGAERAQCKQFLYAKLYDSAALAPEKQSAERIITELFGYWMAHPEALPASQREKAEQSPPARVVCDYIAGMTDHYVSEQHRMICNL